MKTVISTACTHDLPAGCHPSIQQDLRLSAGLPATLTDEQAAFALTLTGVEAVADSVDAHTPEPDPIPEPETPAAEPPSL